MAESLTQLKLNVLRTIQSKISELILSPPTRQGQEIERFEKSLAQELIPAPVLERPVQEQPLQIPWHHLRNRSPW